MIERKIYDCNTIESEFPAIPAVHADMLGEIWSEWWRRNVPMCFIGLLSVAKPSTGDLETSLDMQLSILFYGLILASSYGITLGYMSLNRWQNQ